MKGFGSTTQSQRSVTSSNHRGVWEGARSRRTRPSFFCPYSPECVEEKFCEVRIHGVLGSSLLGMLQAVGHDGTIEGVDSLL
jgi:hypothetical protein